MLVAKETSTSLTLNARKLKKMEGLNTISWALRYEVTGYPETAKEFFFGPSKEPNVLQCYILPLLLKSAVQVQGSLVGLDLIEILLLF